MKAKIMLLKKILFIGLTLFLLLGSAYAQTELPMPLDATDIFNSETVKIVHSLPLYYAEANQVTVYDEADKTWKTYPYPEFPVMHDEETQARFIEMPEGEFWLAVDYFVPCEECEGLGYLREAPMLRERFHFEPTTGTFSPFQAVCGEYSQASTGQGEWVISVNEAGLYLCHTETGQRSSTLPETQGIEAAWLYAAALSADGRYLAFSYRLGLEVYSYDFVENEIKLLGAVVNNSGFRGDRLRIAWADNQAIMVEYVTEDQAGEELHLYRAILAQANSLEHIFSQYRPRIYYLGDSIRYVWGVGRAIDASTPDASPICDYYEYEPGTNTTETFMVEEYCLDYRQIPDGSNDRLGLRYSGTVEPNTSIRFNPETGFREELQIEGLGRLGSFSPDGRYITVSCNFQDLGLLDLESMSLLEGCYPNPSYIVFANWIDNLSFWKADYGDALGGFYQIEGDTLSVQEARFIGISPDKTFLLAQESPESLELFIIESNEMLSLAQVPAGMQIDTSWEAADLLNIKVWQDIGYRLLLGHWQVRVKL